MRLDYYQIVETGDLVHIDFEGNSRYFTEVLAQRLETKCIYLHLPDDVSFGWEADQDLNWDFTSVKKYFVFLGLISIYDVNLENIPV